MNSAFILPDNPVWKKFLNTAKHDFYHLPAYAEFASKYEGGTPGAFYVEDGGASMLVPVLMHSLPSGLDESISGCDFISPYGYPGAIFSGDVDPGKAGILFDGLVAAARQCGAVSVFLRTHPLLSLFPDMMAKIGMLVKHGRTVYGDFCGEKENIWSALCVNHKRDIRKLEKAGYISVCNDFRYWRDFIEIYRATMRRVGAKKLYFFSDQYFDDLMAALDNHLYLWSVISPEGEVASASLFIETGNIVQFHLGGTNERFLRNAPGKKLIFDVGNWAQGRGERYFHLGGGVGGQEDSLFKYKSGFFKNYSEYFTLRVIVDNEKYDALKHQWISVTGNREYDDGFFPIYRQNLE